MAKPKPLAEARPELAAPLAALVDSCLAESAEARPSAPDLLAALSGIAVRVPRSDATKA